MQTKMQRKHSNSARSRHDRVMLSAGAIPSLLAMAMALCLALTAATVRAQGQTNDFGPIDIDAFDENGNPVVARLYTRTPGTNITSVQNGLLFTNTFTYETPEFLFGSFFIVATYTGTGFSCTNESQPDDPGPGNFEPFWKANFNAASIDPFLPGTCYSYASEFCATDIPVQGQPVITRIASGAAYDGSGNWYVFDRMETDTAIFDDCEPDLVVHGRQITATLKGCGTAFDYPEAVPCRFKVNARAYYRQVNAGPDSDGDQIPDGDDNCPADANQFQRDADQDGIGDACDPVYAYDSDFDGVLDNDDNCPYRANADQRDLDGDGQGNVCDADRDGDGFPQESVDAQTASNGGFSPVGDNCPLIANPDQTTSALEPGRGEACEGLPPGC